VDTSSIDNDSKDFDDDEASFGGFGRIIVGPNMREADWGRRIVE